MEERMSYTVTDIPYCGGVIDVEYTEVFRYRREPGGGYWRYMVDRVDVELDSVVWTDGHLVLVWPSEAIARWRRRGQVLIDRFLELAGAIPPMPAGPAGANIDRSIS